MKTPHKHAATIKAWADGAEIQLRCRDGSWVTCGTPPGWSTQCDYRVKPEPKPDIVSIKRIALGLNNQSVYAFSGMAPFNHLYTVCGDIRLVLDGETGKLKSVEVLA